MSNLKYNIYATLLDAYSNYVRSAEVYQQYWGFSESLNKTEEEFEQEQLQSLLDRINRVPFQSAAADKGTAFNEVIDCILLQKKSDKMLIESNKNAGIITVNFREKNFFFPIDLCKAFAEYYDGGVPQVSVEAPIDTERGEVLVYGNIDILMPSSVHDIKTTSKYSSGKYRHGWQHIIYPYCLRKQGNNVDMFEYNVAVIGTKTYETFSECYRYIPDLHEQQLRDELNSFVDFLELNREKITDKKIFNFI